jgi:hypothetical protein
MGRYFHLRTLRTNHNHALVVNACVTRICVSGVPQDFPIGADPNRQKLLVSQEQMSRTQDRLTNAERLATETGAWEHAGYQCDR